VTPVERLEPSSEPRLARTGTNVLDPKRTAKAVQAEPEKAGAELSDLAVADRIVAEATTASAAEHLQEAVDLANRALAVAPDHAGARAVLVIAEQESAEQQRYASFLKFADKQDLSQAIRSYREIGDASRYHARGAERYHSLQQAYVTSFDARAKALADAKDCVELARITRGVADISLEAADASRKRFDAACAAPSEVGSERVKTGDDIVFQASATTNDRPIAREMLDWLAERLRSGTDVVELEIKVTAVFEDAATHEQRVAIASQRGEWLKQQLGGLGVEASRIVVHHTVFTEPRDEDALGSASFWLVKRGTKVEF
jgi:hypothetical protein